MLTPAPPETIVTLALTLTTRPRKMQPAELTALPALVIALEKRVGLSLDGPEPRDDVWLIGPTRVADLAGVRALVASCPLVAALEVTDHSADYVVVQTTAPANYDYPRSASQLGMAPDGALRVVLLARSRASFQIQRYWSGNHAVRHPDGRAVTGDEAQDYT